MPLLNPSHKRNKMSNYLQKAKHPKTGKEEMAEFLDLFWVRFSPALVWRNEAIKWGKKWCENPTVVYEWSWWSLRFTDIYSKCR